MNDQYIKPQFKICGLTQIDDAVQCAELGANAIGFVFYPKSPRFINDKTAKQISLALPEKVITTGVFVNEELEVILNKIDQCRLKAVQLHGNESPDFVDKLCSKGVFVIKALFMGREPFFSCVSEYNASAYLIECGKGTLPGGNALKWNWEKAKDFGVKHPFILAGGLDPDNICNAITSSIPDAVDLSSGVESSPGHKDISKVKKFINNLCPILIKENTRQLRSIF